MRLLWQDESIEVTLQQTPQGRRASVAGMPVELAVEALGAGSFVCRQGDASSVFHCVREGDVLHLAWQGRMYRLEEEREGSRSAHRHQGGGLESPMPGQVMAVKVAPGQTVAKGEELLVIEAMKMENAVRAPRAGVIKTVAVKVGDMVGPGVVLVEIE
jgi:acetyl/propionyl-CoA carboxylase alpha subunit